MNRIGIRSYDELALACFEGNKRLDRHGGGGVLLCERDQDGAAAAPRVRAGYGDTMLRDYVMIPGRQCSRADGATLESARCA